ncbi:hypothetical protein F6X40_41240 [Paraburkholderia sp. UCT31]|uniref:hypothetical protein n=1 Tax=Paraburkholderia sp. UCT31 TaxID=2615209 RepID=UPI001656168F|nr:hypothetical protein [Paraburkholderia sp. UCT31]MBC8742891.1 hypothetical protein [Paraburkholderia sp. UCT31]
MERVIAAADAFGVSLKLTPYRLLYETDWGFESEPEEARRLDALNANALTTEQLEAWYVRLGFVRSGQFDGPGDNATPVLHRMPRTTTLQA